MIYFGWNCEETSKPQTVENYLRNSCFTQPVHLTYQRIARISRAILGKVKQMIWFRDTWEREEKNWRSFKEWSILSLSAQQRHVKDGNDVDDKIFVAG